MMKPGWQVWRARTLTVVLVTGPWATACGDDEAPAPGVTLSRPDAGDADMPDAFVGKPRERPPERDAAAPPPDPDPEPPRRQQPDPVEDEDDAGTCDPESCAERGSECLEGICNEDSGACELLPVADDTPCGSGADTACTDPDTCQAGACVSNHADEGSPCGDRGVECQVDDSCDGQGSCVDNGKQPEGTACGDPTRTDCDWPDACDQDGLCKPNYAPSGTSCNADKLEVCGPDDTCDGTGGCLSQGIYRPKSDPWQADACEFGFETEHDRCRCVFEDINACRPTHGPLCNDAGTACYFPDGSAWLEPGTPCGTGYECNVYGDCVPAE
ncbi:MAG: hypothetical protein OXR73_30710 [Myxococcales bacterium]|nr:hypothetical protein [Myxococcales bacterium]